MELMVRSMTNGGGWLDKRTHPDQYKWMADKLIEGAPHEMLKLEPGGIRFNLPNFPADGKYYKIKIKAERV